jgi:hypothetical protein
VLPAWVSAYYVPLIPNPDGLGCERDLACWFGHSPQHALNFRRLPPGHARAAD